MGSINFNNALGIHPNAMLLRAERAEILANNLANSDTPGFKARDMNFQQVLAGESERQSSLQMAATREGHMHGRSSASDYELMYRNPSQPSIDGNTVDTQIEQTLFTKNTMDYNATFEFLSGKFKGLKGALRGE